MANIVDTKAVYEELQGFFFIFHSGAIEKAIDWLLPLIFASTRSNGRFPKAVQTLQLTEQLAPVTLAHNMTDQALIIL